MMMRSPVRQTRLRGGLSHDEGSIKKDGLSKRVLHLIGAWNTIQKEALFAAVVLHISQRMPSSSFFGRKLVVWRATRM